MDEWEETVHGLKHAAVTFGCFAAAGTISLAPFLVSADPAIAFWASAVATAATLFAVGSMRTLVTRRPFWRSGLEMLLVGTLAGGAAFVLGWAADRALDGS